MKSYKTNDELFREYKITRDYKLRNQIALNNKNLIYPIINKFFIASINDYEELEQEAFIALLKAVEDFNPDLGYQFSTYANKCLLKILRKKLDYNKEISLNQPLKNNDDENIDLIDTLLDESIDINQEVEAKILIEKIKDIVSEKDFQVLELLYIYNLPMVKVGMMLGKSKQAVHKQKNRAIKIIFSRKEFKDYIETKKFIIH